VGPYLVADYGSLVVEVGLEHSYVMGPYLVADYGSLVVELGLKHS
jgi:hypothetical protein